MTQIDNSKIFLEGVYADVTVKNAANTTLEAGTVLGRNSTGDLVAFSTNNNIADVDDEKAHGELLFTGTEGTSVPVGTIVKTSDDVEFETLATAAIATGATTVKIIAQAKNAGIAGNIKDDEALTLKNAVAGISTVAPVSDFSGGVNKVEGYITQPLYILAQKLVNSTQSAESVTMVRVFDGGVVDKNKIIFTKTADATDEAVLDALKRNGFKLEYVQELSEATSLRS